MGSYQNGTANKVRSLPYAFTEQGTAMLATVLHTPLAAEVSVSIMRAFVLMRKYIAKDILPERVSNLETKVIEHDNKFDKIFSMLETEKNNHIFFEGQVYDAYSLLIDILNKAEENIIIIDNYIDKKLLDILSKTEKNITLVTKRLDEITILKYKQQYTNINIVLKENIHDRFIIIDNNILYHCGASFKDLGKRCFAISKFEDKKYLEELLEYIKL